MGEGLNPAAVSSAVGVIHLARVSHWGPEEVMGSARLVCRDGRGGKGCEDIPAVV